MTLLGTLSATLPSCNDGLMSPGYKCNSKSSSVPSEVVVIGSHVDV